jgi:hypothetical protein
MASLNSSESPRSSPTASQLDAYPTVLVVDEEPEMYETINLIFQATPYLVRSGLIRRRGTPSSPYQSGAVHYFA